LICLEEEFMSQSPALEGITVVEMTQAMAGPSAAMALGDLGADVIKVERPGIGDQSRAWGPPFQGGESTYFMSVNRNKRSVLFNLKTVGGRKAMQQLLQRADVFLVNLPRDAQRKANGIDWETLHALNPQLIYGLISGYGATGPDANRPGYDLIAQGLSGLMSITGEPGTPPTRFPLPIADIVTGLYAVIAVEGALLARQHTGQGQFLDLSLQASQVTWLTNVAGAYFATRQLPAKVGNAHPSIAPYGVFRAGDDYLIVCAGTAKLWHALCLTLDAEWLEHEPRFATNEDRVQNKVELTEILSGVLAQRERAYWLEVLDRAGIPCAPILNVAQALSHPQMLHRGMIVEQRHPTANTIHSVGSPILFSETPVSYRRPPPRLGEHTEEVLHWLGYERQEIERLRQEGAVAG
jgi:crotonobetainyl-CoA:carnitine CoA-transferase CaiB-like acyl-CoA transferase